VARIRTLSSAADLDPGLILAVADGQPIRPGRGLLAGVQSRCVQARAVLQAGKPVYGVNTGMGALSHVRLTEAEQAEHQRNLLVGRAVGGPPWLPRPDVRAIFAVRLRTLLSGDAGVSAGLCQRLADFLAADVVPAVPRDAAGSAGEIVQLAHAFGPLAGIGQVLSPDGTTEPAAWALRAHGLTEFVLGPKEGIALLAGVPGATAFSVLAEAEARAVTAMLTAAAGLSIAAIRAPADPYTEACARGDEVLARALAQLRELMPPDVQPRMLQAPVSFRVAGPVLAHLSRATDALAAAVQRALAGVTDSPAFLGDRFVGTAGFHGIDLGAHCDQLGNALTHAAEVAAARTHRLLDPRVTGLPAQLAPRPGPDAGLVAVHKRAVGEVHALRRLAQPASIGLVETSGGQEDVQSFAWEAAVNLRAALQRARVVAACEVLTAFQAATLQAATFQAAAPSGLPSQPAGRALLASLARVVDPVDADRPLGADIERLAIGSWLPAAGA
jgi:histidine ammonia-lyase